ncbi:hypothetical protein SUGI_0675450 [Cryptomeria japonica]|nr:hypothetical protein SUGI_0675450 [Cryptomeria japonica]
MQTASLGGSPVFQSSLFLVEAVLHMLLVPTFSTVICVSLTPIPKQQHSLDLRVEPFLVCHTTERFTSSGTKPPASAFTAFHC